MPEAHRRQPMIRDRGRTCPRSGGHLRQVFPSEPANCSVFGYYEWTLRTIPSATTGRRSGRRSRPRTAACVATGDIIAAVNKANIPQPVTRGFGALMRRAFPGASHRLLPRGWRGSESDRCTNRSARGRRGSVGYAPRRWPPWAVQLANDTFQRIEIAPERPADGRERRKELGDGGTRTLQHLRPGVYGRQDEGLRRV